MTWYLRKKDTPCYMCEDRVMGCHGKCEKYAKFREENEKRKAEAYAVKEVTEALRENTRLQAKRSGKYLRNVYF